jgi:hypothetical protein
MLIFVLAGHSKGQIWVKTHYYEHHNDIVGGSFLKYCYLKATLVQELSKEQFWSLRSQIR